MKSIVKLLVAASLAMGAISGIAYGQGQSTFLKLDGIQGESTDDQHRDEIAIENLSFTVDQTGIRVAGGRGTPARSRFSVITVTKRVDRSSPLLFLRCALGDRIPTATISVRKAGENPQDFLTITLRDVIISSFTTGSGAEVFEQVGLSYTTIEYAYRRQRPDGSLEEAIRATFNVNQNKAALP